MLTFSGYNNETEIFFKTGFVLFLIDVQESKQKLFIFLSACSE